MLEDASAPGPPGLRWLVAWTLSAALLPLRVQSAGAIAATWLPDKKERARVLKCGERGEYLDFTTWTTGNALPTCLDECLSGEALRPESDEHPEGLADGDVPSCVWPKRYPKARLRFFLSEPCQRSTCPWVDRWDFYRQMVSMKITQILGVPLSEVRSALLYWLVPEWPPPPSSPILERFQITRHGEADSLNESRRLFDGPADPWYVLNLAFRVDTERIKMEQRWYDLLNGSDTGRMRQYVGIEAEVLELDFDVSGSSSDEDDEDLRFDSFAPLFEFEGFNPNQIPGEGHELGGVAQNSDRKTCLDMCYDFSEVHNKSKCWNDCECNGGRWCSHLGMCTGEPVPCRSGGEVQTASTTVTFTTRTRTTTATVPLPTSTKSNTPLSRLGKVCFDVVDDLWEECENEIKVQGCTGVSCAVVATALETDACEEELCDDPVTGEEAPLTFWVDKCSSSKTRANFESAREEKCVMLSSGSDVAGAKTSSGTSDDSADVGTVLISVSVCLVVLLNLVVGRWLRLHDRDSTARRCLHRYLGVCGGRRGAQRIAKGKRGSRSGPPPPGAPIRASAQLAAKTERAASKWPDLQQLRHLIAQERPKAFVSTSKVFDSHDAASEETTYSDKSSPSDARPSSDGGSSENSGARQAWSESAKPAREREASGGADGQGPRAAAAAAPVSQAPELNGSPTDSLLKELRRLRTPQHSAVERRRFFREQLLKWHPDKNIGAEAHAADMFKALQDNKGWFLNED